MNICSLADFNSVMCFISSRWWTFFKGLVDTKWLRWKLFTLLSFVWLHFFDGTQMFVLRFFTMKWKRELVHYIPSIRHTMPLSEKIVRFSSPQFPKETSAAKSQCFQRRHCLIISTHLLFISLYSWSSTFQAWQHYASVLCGCVGCRHLSAHNSCCQPLDLNIAS